MYEKIAALIIRNDFHTADKLLKKHAPSLTQEQQDALQQLIETQQQKNQRAAQKNRKNKAFITRWSRLGRIALPLQINLLKMTRAGLILFVPYLKNKITAWPEKFEIPAMETFLLIYLILVSLSCGLEFMDARTGKLSSRAAKQRAEKSGKDDASKLAFTFQRAENKFTQEERNWLMALVFFTLWSLVQLWQVLT